MTTQVLWGDDDELEARVAEMKMKARPNLEAAVGFILCTANADGVVHVTISGDMDYIEALREALDEELGKLDAQERDVN